MTMKKILAFSLLLFAAGTFLGCRADVNDDVYVTVYPLEYVIDFLFEGTGLTCGVVPGVTSHEDSIDWSPKQIIAMTEARFLIYVGANLDVYIDMQADGIFKGKDVTLLKLETAFPDLFIPGVVDDHHEGEEDVSDEPTTLGLDPHFWTSPAKMLDVTDFLYGILLEAYPEQQESLSANRDDLRATLEELDSLYDSVINPDSKPVMTATNLYGYLEYSYGLVCLPISPGYHEETEQFTTLQKETALQEALLHDIRCIIYEKNSSSPLSNAVFDALVAYSPDWDPVKLEYNIMHSLSESDRIDGEGNPINYHTIMLDNLEVFKTATGYSE